MNSASGVKQCARCKEYKPFAMFSRMSSAKDGMQPRCKACAKAYRDARIEEIREKDRRYREQNRDVILAKQRETYRRDPQKRLESNRRWAEANPDKVSARSKRYYIENRERILEYSKEWAAANREKRREYVRRYDAKHPEVHRSVVMRLRARRAGVELLHFPADQIFIRMAYFGFKCWMCRGAFEAVDHVKPLSKGGPHLLSNLRPACRSCNASKGGQWPFPVAMDWS